jgi:hypothetical protein
MIRLTAITRIMPMSERPGKGGQQAERLLRLQFPLLEAITATYR